MGTKVKQVKLTKWEQSAKALLLKARDSANTMAQHVKAALATMKPHAPNGNAAEKWKFYKSEAAKLLKNEANCETVRNYLGTLARFPACGKPIPATMAEAREGANKLAKQVGAKARGTRQPNKTATADDAKPRALTTTEADGIAEVRVSHWLRTADGQIRLRKLCEKYGFTLTATMASATTETPKRATKRANGAKRPGKVTTTQAQA